MTYSFNIINWTFTEIKKMDIKVRKLIICHYMHYPRTEIENVFKSIKISIYLSIGVEFFSKLDIVSSKYIASKYIAHLVRIELKLDLI